MSYVLYDPEAPVITPKRPKRDTTKIVLTDEQRKYLVENYHDTLNKDLAAHCFASHRYPTQSSPSNDTARIFRQSSRHA